jgi:mannitol 2-dehydrogenase
MPTSGRQTAEPLTLSERTLPRLCRRFDLPTYDRTSLSPGVVHIGVGGFHRAHQAVYLDELARLGETAWGEVGIGLRTPRMRDALVPQDLLYSVVARDAEADQLRVVGSIVRYVYAPEDPVGALDALADERTRIVTLTITGDGYTPDEDGAFGYIVNALDRRRRNGLPGFTILSCDNIPSNGAAARSAAMEVAARRGDDLVAWMAENVSFPSSMVDRITPECNDAARAFVADRFGVLDRSPVITEPFTQWVVEDDFCNGRPPLELVGVQFVEDVEPYKVIKTRLLNASHSALGYVGTLAGYRTTSDAMANPAIRDYISALMAEDVAPFLPTVPGLDLAAYQATLLERFANPRISDELARLCGRGSTKMPAYLLPSLVAARAEDRPARLLAVAVAAWYRYFRGVDADGTPIEVRDALADVLGPLAAGPTNDPRAFLAERSIFGDLADDADLAAFVEELAETIERYGSVATICEALARDVTMA